MKLFRVFLFALVFVCLAALFSVKPAQAKQFPGDNTDARLAAVEKAIADLNARLDALSRPDPLAQQPARSAPVTVNAAPARTGYYARFCNGRGCTVAWVDTTPAEGYAVASARTVTYSAPTVTTYSAPVYSTVYAEADGGCSVEVGLAREERPGLLRKVFLGPTRPARGR